MSDFKFYLLFFLVALPAVTSLTLLEDFYITRQLLAFFGDVFNDESSENGSNSGDKKPASLLSQYDIKDRADHYWTRLGHKSRTTVPPYNYDYYYYRNQNSMENGSNGFTLGKRKKRNVLLTVRRLDKKEMEVNRGVDANGFVMIDQQNSTMELPKPMNDVKFKRGMKKCCADSEEGLTSVNQNLQMIKTHCIKETKNSIKRNITNSSTGNGDNGFYNLFSCDKLNRWKAAVTCVINCMGQKLEVIDANGNINTDNVKSVILQNFAQQKWQQNFIDDFMDKCINEISHFTNFVMDKSGIQCSTKMAEFTYCMWRKFFVSCPAERQNKSKECEKLRIILMKTNESTLSNYY